MGDTDSAMVERRNFRTHPITADEVQMLRWYATEDDLIGGTLIATVDKPASQIDPYAGEFEVATFVAQGLAEHLIDLHNDWLDAYVWSTYRINIALSAYTEGLTEDDWFDYSHPHEAT
jgi:hypothetical protein